MQQGIDRIPPHDLGAEKAVLGSMLIEPESVGKVIDILHSDCFYAKKNGEIFTASKELFLKSEPVDMLTVGNALKMKNILDEVGGNIYLTDLANSIASAINVEYHARIVLDKSNRRKKITESMKAIQACYDGEDFGLIIKADQDVNFNLLTNGMQGGFKHIAEIARDSLVHLDDIQSGKIEFIRTYFDSLDRYAFNGFTPGSLTLIGARPGMGKTALVLNLLDNITQRQIPSGLFTLENTGLSLAWRNLASKTQLDSRRFFRKGELNDKEIIALHKKANLLSNQPLFIDEKAGINIAQIRARAQRLVTEHGARIIFVDHIGLINNEDVAESRHLQLSFLSWQLKQLAKDLNIPVVIVSQLNRKLEQRIDKRPMKSDLRESGSLEENADNIIFVYRPSYYASHEDIVNGDVSSRDVEIIIAKQREGSISTEHLDFYPEYGQFRDPEHKEQAQKMKEMF